jgi:hypothetical protein
MLVDGRPEMVARAIRCFEAQTYGQRELLLYDTGTPHYRLDEFCHIETTRQPGATIGNLRNLANTAAHWADIIVHWDSDDWSAPERIAEQVALLTNQPPRAAIPKTEAVGYSDMLFWRTPIECYNPDEAKARVGEAWLYTGAPNYMCGASLCYWRDTWKRKPFPAKNSGEDTEWQMGLQSLSMPSVSTRPSKYAGLNPRMVQSIHGGNTASHVDQRSRQWRRVPEWDEYCRKVFA